MNETKREGQNSAVTVEALLIVSPTRREIHTPLNGLLGLAQIGWCHSE
jgi:hypothetical protein